MNIRNKAENRSRNLPWLIVTAIAALCFLGGVTYLGRGVLRSNILPAYASYFHKDELTTVTQAQSSSADVGLQPLDIKFNHMIIDSCTLDIAIKWSTAIYCDAEIDSETLAGNLNSTGASVLQANRAMHRLGWTGGVDSSNFVLLSYDKNIQGFDCTIQVFGAPSSESRLFCTRDYFYFGNPYNDSTSL
jgi:hypothetical protein